MSQNSDLNIFNKLIDLINLKRDFIFNAINTKRGNHNKPEIKDYINQLSDDLINEIKTQTNALNTPSTTNSQSLDLDKTVDEIKTTFSELSSDEKVDKIFNEVMNLKIKVEENSQNLQNRRQYPNKNFHKRRDQSNRFDRSTQNYRSADWRPNFNKNMYYNRNPQFSRNSNRNNNWGPKYDTHPNRYFRNYSTGVQNYHPIYPISTPFQHILPGTSSQPQFQDNNNAVFLGMPYQMNQNVNTTQPINQQFKG